MTSEFIATPAAMLICHPCAFIIGSNQATGTEPDPTAIKHCENKMTLTTALRAIIIKILQRMLNHYLLATSAFQKRAGRTGIRRLIFWYLIFKPKVKVTE